MTVAAIALATLGPDPDQVVTPHSCLICGSRGGVDAVLNILMFLPLGVGLALVGWRLAVALPAMFVFSVLIELAQLFIPGRDATVGDVLTNTLGGALGLLLAGYAAHFFRPSRHLALTLSIAWCTAWLAVQTTVNFAFAPAFPNSTYYGEIARRLGDFELFRGSVVAADVGGVSIPDTRFDDSPRARLLLTRGAPLSITVVPAARTSGIAPIVRVADGQQREIVMLAQQRDKFLFGVRTGAAVLRLRPPLFALPGVFPTNGGDDSARADTLRITGVYTASNVLLHAQARSTERGSRVHVSGSLGWTLLLPFQWLIEGTVGEHIINWTWTAILLVPLGYWSLRSFDHRKFVTGQWAVTLIAALAVFVAGFELLPRAFGGMGAPVSDWLAAAAGLLAGYALAANATANGAARYPQRNETPR